MERLNYCSQSPQVLLKRYFMISPCAKEDAPPIQELWIFHENVVSYDFCAI